MTSTPFRLELVTGVEVVGQHVAERLRRDVVAHHLGLEVRAGPGGADLGRRVDVDTGQLQRRSGRHRCGALGGGVADRLEAGQRRPGLDLAAGHHHQLAHPRLEGGPQHRLHLHALQHQHRGTGGDDVADGHRRADHQGGRGGAEHAALVAGDPVGHPVDLDVVDGVVGGGHQAVPAPADAQPGVVLVASLELGHHDLLLTGGRGDADPEAVRPGLQHADLVRRAAQLEVDLATDPVLDLGPATVGALEQPGDLDLGLVLVGLDAGRDQRDAGVLVDHSRPSARARSIQAGVGPAGAAAVDDLGLVEQVEHEGLVGGPALDDHGGLGQRATQAGQCLLAVAAVGDDLGDHRVEVRGDDVALADAGVDPDARPRGQLQQRDPAGGGREVAVGVLGVEPGLDGVAPLDRALALETPAGRDPDLGLDQVEVGGRPR